MGSFKLTRKEYVEVLYERNYTFTEKDVEEFKEVYLKNHQYDHAVDKDRYTEIINNVTLEDFAAAANNEFDEEVTWESEYRTYDNEIYRYTEYLDTIIYDWINEVVWDEDICYEEVLDTTYVDNKIEWVE